jgi:hypothetical protein
VRLLIQKLWKRAWDKLDHRNDVLHRQENMVSQAEAGIMNAQIRDLFTVGSRGFLSQVRYLFTGHSIGAALLLSLRQKKAWLNLADNAFKARQTSFG